MADERWKQLNEDWKEMVNILNKHGFILELSDEVPS
jgi:putative heme iron utilization protein